MRVMTYNILDGGENREKHILNVIQTSKPDVVILQEVFSEEILKFLSQSLGMNYYFGTGNKRRKTALMSKVPVKTFQSYHPVFPIWRNFIIADIEYKPNNTVRVIGVHPMANLGILFEIWRLWEAQYVIRYSKNNFCIIAGDFNAIAPKDKVITENMPSWLKLLIFLQGNRVYHFSIEKILSAGFIDCFRLLNFDEGFTLPPPNPNARLDYIFINEEMRECLKNCWVVREPDSVNLASDHYPVIAELSFLK